MAARGAKVAVVTIDPARRLANALGLEELENEPSRIDPRRLERTGLEMKASCGR
jgi:anion-transporting  ArsA/GET3 family ATPase